MYETHFGLKKRPFRALALGNDVFIGPQTAAAMAAIKKALATPDAIAAVIGPVGGGKTTVVGRALAGLGQQCITVPVGRIKLGTDEVLELLLGELGVGEMPASTVQRFTLFRRTLKESAEDGARIVIVVEDAARIGADSLSELEALTAADAGVSDGANIVLMGDEGLKTLLSAPELARTKQRLRVRQLLAPLAGNELHAYFRHCFRLAGGDYDSLFAGDAAALIHDLSGGIPRMANNLVESAMAAAAEAGDTRVSADHIRTVAASEYGLEAEAPESPPAAATVASTAAEPELTIEPAMPEAEATPPEDFASANEDDIPELIQDTLPDLEVLAPQLTAATPHRNEAPANDDHEPPAVPTTSETLAAPVEGTAQTIADSPAETEAPVRETNDKVPDWEREPTLAELRPDLDALEQAMAVAQGLGKDDEEDLPVIQPEPVAEKAPEVVPEITLDREIQAKIEEAAEAIKRTEEAAAAKAAADAEAEKSIDLAATGEIPVDLPPLKPSSAEESNAESPAPESPAQSEPAVEQDSGDSAELKRIATNLSRAKTIDDVDDKMAETLFGEEFSEIAAQVAAKASSIPANDELELVEEEPAARPAAAGSFNGSAAVSVTPSAKSNGSPPQLDEAASRRLATVRALNGSQNVAPPVPPSAESIVMSHEPASPLPPSYGAQPESIEDQINTSMTATLQAISEMPSEEDDEDEGKKGFFSRFRRS